MSLDLVFLQIQYLTVEDAIKVFIALGAGIGGLYAALFKINRCVGRIEGFVKAKHGSD